MIDKAVIVILDGFGVGALEDAHIYNDQSANTLLNIVSKRPNINIPNLTKLGLFNCLNGNKPAIGCYGKMKEASLGKDTTTGHWELTGVILDRPFPTYPHGFPKELIAEFEKRISRKTLGNFPCSGTKIIEMLGEEHIKTGYPIVYTSADSVFQIAAHEEVIPLEELYRICQIARKLLDGEHRVARVIARPFIGEPGNFKRTSNRRDFSVSPPYETLLDKIKNHGGEVIGIGKIDDIFNNCGITDSIHTTSNLDGIFKTIKAIKEETDKVRLIFTNLIDFDMIWGHRRNIDGYVRGLEEFDGFLPEIISSLDEDSVLFITSDHGNDPTYIVHTDHTREYVPLLVYGKRIKQNVNLGIRQTFADLGQTIADFFGVEALKNGMSFKRMIYAD